MKCRRCGYDINTLNRQPDGTVVCPGCGTVYRRKAEAVSSQPLPPVSNQPKAAQTESASMNANRRLGTVQNSGNEASRQSSLVFTGRTRTDVAIDHSAIPKLQPEKSDQHHKTADKPIVKQQPKPKKEKAQRQPKPKKEGKHRHRALKIILIFLLISVIGLLGYLFFTGRMTELFSQKTSQIDPNKDVIEVIPDQSLPVCPSSSSAHIVVTGDNVNVREQADINSPVLKIAHRGERFDYLASAIDVSDNTWYQIKKDEIIGWISENFSVLYEDTAHESTTAEPTTNTALFNLTLVDEDMTSVEVDVNTHLCFTVRCSGSVSSPIHLIRKDTGEIIGEMKDDGNGEDYSAGDHIYTLGLNINGGQFGKIDYWAEMNTEYSNTVSVRFYEGINDSNYTHAESILSQASAVGLSYSDGAGYFTEANKDNIPLAVNAVAAYIEQQYYEGAVSTYCVNEDSVYFKDAVTGIAMVYQPYLENTNADGDDMKIVLFAPYASEGLPPEASLAAVYTLDSEFDNISFNNNDCIRDGTVTPDKVMSVLGPNEVIIWDGHGGYNSEVHSFLVTGKSDNDFYHLFHTDDFRNDRVLVCVDNRIAITSKYIDKYCGRLDGSFIFLSACHGLQDLTLAQSFGNKGAAVICGFNESVYTLYSNAIIRDFFAVMSSINPSTGQYYTVFEALGQTVPHVGYTDVEYHDFRFGEPENPKASATLTFTGNTDFRFSYFTVSSTPVPTATYAPVPTATSTPLPTQIPTNLPQNIQGFTLNGTWKSVGSYGFGQAQPGAIVAFDGTHCNFYSPYDTYAFYQKNGQYVLDITSFIFGENLTFDVQIIDNDNIKIIHNKTYITELTRSGVGAQVNTIVNDINDLINMFGN